MISTRVRRAVHIIQTETGGSVQDILQAMVAATHGGVITFSDKLFCTFCGSLLVLSRGGPRSRPALGIRLRSHICGFCNATFQSEEQISIEKPVTITKETPAPIEKPRKRTQNKNRKS